jgi:ketosteroid isomerase-like protein
MIASLQKPLTLSFAILVTGCAPALTVNQQSEEAAIRTIGQDWQRAIVTRDVDRIASFFAPDVVIMIPNAPVTRGWAAARKLWSDEVNIPGVAVTWIPSKIEITSPTTATEIGSYKFAFDGPKGRVNDTGSYAINWKKIDGRWLMVTDAIVSDQPTGC